MTRVAIPALIVMFAVGALVGAAGWNRSADPRLTIALTERELPLTMMPAESSGDDPGVRLRIAHEYRGEPLDTRNWLPQPRLQEIGFEFDVAAGAPQAAYTYDNVPPRVTWVVFEYDGPAWREIERRRALRTQEDSRHAPYPRSRLVPVDAGSDFEALRVRYPSRHLIMRGIVGVSYLAPEHGGPLVYGVLREVVPSTVAVPTYLRGVFDGLTDRAPGIEPLPRYEAEVGIGRLGLPYLLTARRLQ